MRILNFLLSMLFVSAKIWAQDQHEPQIWQKIHSPFVNVIYKQGQKKEALTIVNTINYIQKNNSGSIGNHTKPIDIILRANTVDSNGFVTYSPFRSEFFNTSPPTFNNLGTTNWLSTLAIHEYRHVQQFLNHKAGFTNFLYYLIGQRGWAIGSAIAIPDWYFEGDAVTMETALTNSGRGRLPKFTALQRALLQNKTTYTYQKIRNGSYKDLVPNIYATGYQILNYYRNHFDAQKLDNIAKSAASFSFPFYGFSHYIKKETGLTTTKLYQKTIDEGLIKMNNQQQKSNLLNYPNYSKTTNKTVHFYSYPQFLENGSIIALKSSFNQIPIFCTIDSLGNESKITNSIINSDSYFHYQNNQLVFSGYKYHPRYTASNYHDLYIYDLNKKNKKRITFKKRYFSPSFNSNNSKIIAIDNNQNKHYLVVLNSNDGAVLDRIKVDGTATRPKFIDKNTFIYIRHKNHQLSIFKTTKEGNTTQLTPWTSHTVDDIRIHKNFVYYSASFNGIDNIYQSPLDGSLKIKQMTRANIGAYQPFIKNNILYFTETTHSGNKISYSALSTVDFKIKEPVLMDWNNSQSIRFEKGSILDKIPTNTNYKISKYGSIFNGLRIHDWEYSFREEQIAVTANATNLLNNFSLVGSTNVFLREKNSFKVATLASYKKWFPILNLEIDFSYRNFNTTLNTNNIVVKGEQTFNDIALNPSITIPLTQINGNYFRNLSLNLGSEYHHLSNNSFELEDGSKTLILENSRYNLFNLKIAASSISRKAKQHINPHAGISSKLNYNQTLNGVFKGYFLKTISRIHFPGLLKNHNSFITYSQQFNSIHRNNQYLNLKADTFIYARGFKTINHAKETQKISLTYQLPLFYPDFGVAGITYFKRIRANLFADFSRVKYAVYRKNDLLKLLYTKQNSVGVEILFDNTFLNISQAEISLGYRGSYLLTKDNINPNNQFISNFFISTSLF